MCRLAEVSKPRGGRPRAGHKTVAPSRARRNCPDGGRVPHSAGCRSEPPLPSHRDKPELCFRDTLMMPERPERNMGTRRNQRWRPRVALRRARPATHRGRSLASLRRAGLFTPPCLHATTWGTNGCGTVSVIAGLPSRRFLCTSGARCRSLSQQQVQALRTRNEADITCHQDLGQPVRASDGLPASHPPALLL